jgi:hypothetical protein
MTGRFLTATPAGLAYLIAAPTGVAPAGLATLMRPHAAFNAHGDA